MTKQQCPECGRFMRDTMMIPEDDEFDEELAYEYGLAEEDLTDALFDFDGKWSRFHYIEDHMECDHCDILIPKEGGLRYWWNPNSGGYDGDKPLTRKERAEQKRQRQEAAGQLRLFGEDGQS